MTSLQLLSRGDTRVRCLHQERVPVLEQGAHGASTKQQERLHYRGTSLPNGQPMPVIAREVDVGQ